MSSPSSADKKAVLDTERAVNEQYIRLMEEKLEKQPSLIKEISVMQSQHWTTAGLPRPGLDPGALSAVIGRVALEDDHSLDDHVRDSIYIAGWRIETDEFETVNWAAPIASIFFEGRDAPYELASSVLARRTFVLRLGDLVDFHDDVEEVGTQPFERVRRKLEIPAAPGRQSSAPVQVPTEEAEERPEAQQEPLVVDAPPEVAEEPVVAPEPQAEEQPAEVEEVPDGLVTSIAGRLGGLRAAGAVAEVIDMPKTGRMGSVLPTMQPEQYHLVSWSPTLPLIVQGQPGTGKTVVAAHRAVWLTSEEREGDRIARLAIIGPSDHYVDHVAPIVSELKEPVAEVRVISLPSMLQRMAGLPNRPKPGPIERIESMWELGRGVEQAVRAMTDRPKSGRMDKRVRAVVERFKSSDLSMVTNTEVRDWLGDLPSWTTLITEARYLPMLASVALALDPRAAGESVGHLIVDEAQDVRPLEWSILTKSLMKSGGEMTLLGDMNQRRSDWTASSWNELATTLELTDDGGESPIEVLETGYRSTKQILRFANSLLPRGDRGEQSLRDGPDPTVRKVREADRTQIVVDEAEALARRHRGFIAIIAVDPKPCGIELRRRHWVRGRFQNSWVKDDHTIVLLMPDEARGLEFDAVVVVEPADIPDNVGRQGVLYTALTRANQELSVVHSNPLPKELRGRVAR